MAQPPRDATQDVRISWPDGHSERARLRALGKSGGAGEVFDIEGHPHQVAKIYHDTLAADQRAVYAGKIAWMTRNRPQLPPVPHDSRDIVQLAWPAAALYRGSGFAGFAMPKVDFARTLELDYLLTRRQAAAEGFEADFGKLVAVCHNLAALIDCLHARGIAVVDLKPINLKVYKSELYVAILDCDGFFIARDGFVAEAPQVTPEYLAPEFHGRPVVRPFDQDRFALATIVFRLLNFGIHPYAGIAAPGAEQPTELAGRIRLGLYAYGRIAHPRARPTPASMHTTLPDEMRTLFDRAFAPLPHDRPAAHEWVEVLGHFASRARSALVHCERRHLHFSGYDCATCRREGLLHEHARRQRRLGTRLRAAPRRALVYMQRSIRGTQTSPFQAALAQAQLHAPHLAPQTLPISATLAIELLWTLGLAITYWWIR